MPLFLSDTSESIKQKAEQISFKVGHFYMGCEHIFLAAMDSEGGFYEQIKKFGGDPEGLREKILKLAGPGDENPLWNGIIVTPRLKKILKLAEKEAESQKSVRIEPMHIISAMIKEGQSLPVRAMEEMGMDIQRFRKAIMDEAPASQPLKGNYYPPPQAYNYQKTPPKSVGKNGSKDEVKDKEKIADKDKKSKTPTLDKLGRDLVKMANDGKFDPIIGRNDEIRRMIQTLSKKSKNNPIIIGEAGVGKTAVVYGLAQRISEGKVPDSIKNKKIIELGMASIVAGTKHRGEFEEKMQNIIEELTANPDLMVFIDEIHTIMGAGDSRGGMDAGNIIKPYLARGEITVIGATTIDEYRKYIEKDPALERRFQPVMVDEPSEEDTVKILNGLKEKYEKHHGVIFNPKALLQAVKLSVRYLPDRNLPDKAIDLMDEAAAKSKMKSVSIADDDKLENLKIEITEEDIAEVVSLWTGIQASKLTQEESERLLHMEEAMKNKVVGQDHAVRTVAQTIRMVRMGLSSPNRPNGVFLFLGPTGVGKTELAKTLAGFLFDSEKDLVRIDMSEFMEKHAISRLIGSPPGYVGHEEEGQLTKQVRTKPYCVVLLDEVEKAHPDVFDLFLQVFDEGRLTDSKGRMVNFTNTILIMTSNIGTSKIDAQGNPMLLNSDDPRIREGIMRELRKHFRPEFLNRIDEIVIFRPLAKDSLKDIVWIQVKDLAHRLFEQKEVTLDIQETAVNCLLKVGYNPSYGARPMKRAIQTYLAKPLASAMLSCGVQPGDTITVASDGRKIFFGYNGQWIEGNDMDEDMEEGTEPDEPQPDDEPDSGGGGLYYQDDEEYYGEEGEEEQPEEEEGYYEGEEQEEGYYDEEEQEEGYYEGEEQEEGYYDEDQQDMMETQAGGKPPVQPPVVPQQPGRRESVAPPVQQPRIKEPVQPPQQPRARESAPSPVPQSRTKQSQSPPVNPLTPPQSPPSLDHQDLQETRPGGKAPLQAFKPPVASREKGFQPMKFPPPTEGQKPSPVPAKPGEEGLDVYGKRPVKYPQKSAFPQGVMKTQSSQEEKGLPEDDIPTRIGKGLAGVAQGGISAPVMKKSEQKPVESDQLKIKPPEPGSPTVMTPQRARKMVGQMQRPSLGQKPPTESAPAQKSPELLRKSESSLKTGRPLPGGVSSFGKEPILKQRHEFQKIQGMVPMKGIGSGGIAENANFLDERDFTETRPTKKPGRGG